MLQSQKMVQMIDRATSNDLQAPNSTYNNEIIQEINSKADMARESVKIIKKKLSNHQQPKTIFLSLILTDMAMQKCGQPFHVQVGTKEFMNVMVALLHNKDLMKDIHTKVLKLIKQWGERFEKDHDIMPLFTDIYRALQKKGFTFSGSASAAQQSSSHSSQSNTQPAQRAAPQRQAAPVSKPQQSNPNKKDVRRLAQKDQKVIKELNLLKGNINMTNEMLDNCKSRQELKENQVVLDLLKTLKEMEPKLHEKIGSTEDEDITAVLLLVNEDMQKTFQRFKQLKNEQAMDQFVPGEYAQIETIQYLEPTYFYGQDQEQKNQSQNSGGVQGGDGPNLLDMMGGGPPVQSAPQVAPQQQQQQNKGFDFNKEAFGTSNNDPMFQLENILQAQQQQQQQQQQQPPQMNQFGGGNMMGGPPQNNQFQTGMPMGGGGMQPNPGMGMGNNFFTGAPMQQQMGGGFPGHFQTGAQQQPMGFNPMQAQQMPQQQNPMANMFGTSPINPPFGGNQPKFAGGGGNNQMPEFLRKKQEEQSNQNSKSDLTGLMNLDPSKFNLGVQGSQQNAGGSGSNPFDNFGGPSAGANNNSVGFQDTFANANPSSSNNNDFGDLFNKDWLKGSGGGIKRKMDSNQYAYNPVDLNQMNMNKQSQPNPPAQPKEAPKSTFQAPPANDIFSGGAAGSGSSQPSNPPVSMQQPPAAAQQQQQNDLFAASSQPVVPQQQAVKPEEPKPQQQDAFGGSQAPAEAPKAAAADPFAQMSMQMPAEPSNPAPAQQKADDPFGGFNDDFAKMGFGNSNNNEPPKAETGADNMAFDFGGPDPGVGSGNNIFGNFGSNINPAANDSQNFGSNNLQAFDSYTDPFADPGPGAASNNAGNNEQKNDGGLFDFM